MRNCQRILVTGASGTVGTALMEQLLDLGYDVVGADITPNQWSSGVDDRTITVDLRDKDELSALPGDVDLIIHLAANARVRALVEQPWKARDNFEMTFNMLEFARQNEVPRFMFSSSREVYGDGGRTVHREEETAVDECESPYTASKVGGEAMVEAYARCYGIDATILRFSNVYGRYDVSDRVVPLFIAQAARGDDLSVYGQNKVLDFTYIDDCVNGIVGAIENFEAAAGMTFNLASGEGMSLLSLAEKITDIVQTDAEIRIEESKIGEVNRFVADISKANAVLDYEPIHTNQGLEQAVSWYRQYNLTDEILTSQPTASGERTPI